MLRSPLAAAFAAALATGIAQPAAAQDDADQRLGTVHFATSCNEAAQRRFDRAMRYQHSFWYRASKEIFEEALKADPDCGIAYWGIALSLLNNPHNPPPAAQSPARACRHPEGEGGRRQDRSASATSSTRWRCSIPITTRSPMARACRPISRRWKHWRSAIPHDDEAQIFYAITLNVAASPSDKTYANQLKGAAILEPIFKRQPRHPGVAHYLIHLYDYPAAGGEGHRCRQALCQDRAGRAARAAHALAHLHARRLLEGIDRLQHRAGAAAKADKEFDDQLHAMDYMVYAYLQLAQD